MSDGPSPWNGLTAAGCRGKRGHLTIPAHSPRQPHKSHSPFNSASPGGPLHGPQHTQSHGHSLTHRAAHGDTAIHRAVHLNTQPQHSCPCRHSPNIQHYMQTRTQLYTWTHGHKHVHTYIAVLTDTPLETYSFTCRHNNITTREHKLQYTQLYRDTQPHTESMYRQSPHSDIPSQAASDPGTQSTVTRVHGHPYKHSHPILMPTWAQPQAGPPPADLPVVPHRTKGVLSACGSKNWRAEQECPYWPAGTSRAHTRATDTSTPWRWADAGCGLPTPEPWKAAHAQLQPPCPALQQPGGAFGPQSREWRASKTPSSPTPGYWAPFLSFLGLRVPNCTGLLKVEQTNKGTAQIQLKQENHLLYSESWKLPCESEKRCNRGNSPGAKCRKRPVDPSVLGAKRAVQRRLSERTGGRSPAPAPPGRWRKKRAEESTQFLSDCTTGGGVHITPHPSQGY